MLPDAPFPVHTGSQLHFHHGARALVCRCILLGQDVLRPGEAGWAQLRFTQSVAAAPGDRFVARFFSPLATVGGGVLVDLAPPGKGRMRPERLARLAALAEGRPLLAAESPAAPAAPAAPAPSAEAEGELEALYLGYGLEPPPWARVEPRFAGRIREARRACRRLKERGVLLELSTGHLLHAGAVRAAEARLRGRFGPASFSLAEARDALGCSRRCALLLLEHWDASGVTRRQGEVPDFFHICLTCGGKPAMMGVDMGAEGPLVGPPVFKIDGDGAPVLVCSIRTRPRHGLRTALLARGSAGMAKPLSRAGRFFASNRDPRCWARGWAVALSTARLCHAVPPGRRNLLAWSGGSSLPTATHCAAVGGSAALRMPHTPCGCCFGLAVGGPPCGRRLETRPFLGKGACRHVQIPLLARRRLCNTFNAQEVGQLRAALQDAGVEFVITQDSRPVGGFSGYGTSGPALHLGAGAAPFEYTVYVHKDDLALAESAIQGTVG